MDNYEAFINHIINPYLEANKELLDNIIEILS